MSCSKLDRMLQIDLGKACLFTARSASNPSTTSADGMQKMAPRLISLLGGLAMLPSLAGETFTNPIAEGADQWVVRHRGKYVWCQSVGNRGVSLWVSDRLTSLGNRRVVWRPPASGP